MKNENLNKMENQFLVIEIKTKTKNEFEFFPFIYFLMKNPYHILVPKTPKRLENLFSDFAIN